jgi:deoxycytidylate deaminase
MRRSPTLASNSPGGARIPRGGVKERPERFLEKDEKLKWVAPAEANAVFNASRTGISLVGGTIYATTFPCVICAIASVQAGIVRVFSPGRYCESDPNGYERASEIFADAGTAFDVLQDRKRDYELRRKPAANDPQATPKAATPNDLAQPTDQTPRPKAAGARRKSSSIGVRKAAKQRKRPGGTGAAKRSDPTGRSRKPRKLKRCAGHARGGLRTADAWALVEAHVPRRGRRTERLILLAIGGALRKITHLSEADGGTPRPAVQSEQDT